MAKLKKALFSGGEVDPALYDSTDAKDWGLGLKTARNVLLGRNGRILNSQGTWALNTFTGATKVVAVEPDGYILVFWVDTANDRIRVSATFMNDFLRFEDLTAATTWFTTTAINNSTNLTGLKFKVVKEFDGTIFVYVTQSGAGFDGPDDEVLKFRFTGISITRENVYLENIPSAQGVNFTVNNFSDLAAITDLYIGASRYVVADATVGLRGWYKYDGAAWVQITVNTIADLTAGNYNVSKAAWDALTGAPVQYGITLVFSNGEESTINPIVTYRPTGSTNTAEYTAYTKLPTVGDSLTYTFNNIYFLNSEYNGKLESARIYRRPVVAGGTYGNVTGAGAWGFVGAATVSSQTVNESQSVTVNFSDFGVEANYADQPPYFSQDLNDFKSKYAVTNSPNSYRTPLSAKNIFEYNSRLVYTREDLVLFSAIALPNRFARDFPTDEVNSFLLKIGTSKPIVSGITEKNGLFIYTNQGVWAGVNSVTSQADPRIRKIGDWIVDTDVPPISTIWGEFFVDKTTNDLRRITYSNEENDFYGVSVSDLAAHIFRNKKIVSMAFMSGETPYLCCVLSDGTIANLFYDDKQRIFGWTRKEREFGNYISVESYHHLATGNVVLIHSVEEDGLVYLEVESLRETFNNESNNFLNFVTFSNRSKMIPYIDLIFFNELKRNNVEDWGTELVIEAVDSGAQVGKYFKAFSDDLVETCLLKYDRLNADNYPVFKVAEQALPESMRGKEILIAPTRTEVTGLEYLEGRKVSVIADGAIMSSPYNDNYSTLQVVDGKITLPKPSVHIIVGLPYISDIATLEIDMNRQGLTITDTKLVNRVFVKYAQSRGGYVSGALPKENTVKDMQDAESWSIYDTVNRTKQPEDVRKEYRNMSSWKYNGSIGIRQADPLPLQVTSITLDLVGG